MKENGSKTSDKEEAPKFGQMAPCMKVIGATEKPMAEED
jgi:hypothetical protein